MWLKSKNKLLNLKDVNLIELIDGNKIRIIINNVEHHVTHTSETESKQCFNVFYEVIQKTNDIVVIGEDESN